MNDKTATHVHGFLCAETVEHAEASTPIYDETAWDHGHDCTTARRGAVMTASVFYLPNAAGPVDDGDARHVITQALSHASSLTFEVGPRSFDFTLQSGVGESRAEVTVHHADAPQGDDGVHYALTFTRLAWCDTHRRSYHAADRLCAECVLDQMEGDQ